MNLDDIIVVSKSFQIHLELLQKVFDHNQNAGMKLSPNKCIYLGDKVCSGGDKAASQKSSWVST